MMIIIIAIPEHLPVRAHSANRNGDSNNNNCKFKYNCKQCLTLSISLFPMQSSTMCPVHAAA